MRPRCAPMPLPGDWFSMAIGTEPLGLNGLAVPRLGAVTSDEGLPAPRGAGPHRGLP